MSPPDDPAPTETDDAAAEAWLAKLETLRRSVDLRLDGEGRWFHDGEPFAHQGLIAAFDRGIDAHPDSGEPILRLGSRWCYIRADDTPFVARRITADGDRLTLRLNTGASVTVPARGFEARGARLYVRLDDGRRVRLSRAAQAKAGGWLEEGDGGMRVAVAGRRYPVRPVDGPEPTA